MQRLHVLFAKRSKGIISHLIGKYDNKLWIHSMNSALSYYKECKFEYYVTINYNNKNLVIKDEKGEKERLELEAVTKSTLSESLLDYKGELNDMITVTELVNLYKKNSVSDNLPNMLSPYTIYVEDLSTINYELKHVSAINFIEDVITPLHKSSPKFSYSHIIEVEEPLADLKFLARKWANGIHILKPSEYENLIKYLQYTIENKKLPDNIKKIVSTAAPKSFIQFAFFLFLKRHKKTMKKELMINFLHAVFEEFSSEHTKTTSSKFSKHYKGFESIVEKLLKSPK